MRKIAFALAHCFQTWLKLPACCSMCLLSACLLGYWLKLSVNRLEISRCLFTGLHSRAKTLSVSREITSICMMLSDFCASYETFSHEIKTLVSNFARLVKLSRAACETFSHGTELLHAACQGSSRETVCQHYHFFGLFWLFASRTLYPLSSLLFPVGEQSWTVTLCFTESMTLAL